MACKTREEFEERVYIHRLVYDVLVYTLPKCGFPETELPPTDHEDNVYNRVHFVEIAGLSALRVSLILRDKWKQMFVSRRKSTGFHEENIKRFLKQVTVCCFLSWTDTKQSIVETLLALCNEIIMFFHHERIDIDLHIILNSISILIIAVISSHRIEELFGKFDDIPGYTRWITRFISDFAIPYGSQDVSDHFFLYVREKWIDDLQRNNFPDTISITEMRDYLGFLPDDLFTMITFKDFSHPKNLASTSKSILPSDHESSEVVMSPSDHESSAQTEDTSKNSSELRIDNDFGQMNLGSEETSQESHEVIPKRKKTKKSKKTSGKKASKEREELTFSEKDLVYLQRLVYDVLVYTLPKCGFPETELPSTDYKENEYNRVHLVEIAGLSALRISLILRDKWKQLFTSRRNSSGFHEDDITIFLKHVVLCCFLSWTDTVQSVVEALLALCNEIIMFFFHEGIDIDLHIILNSTSICIVTVVSSYQNKPKTIEELFAKFDSISEYTRWITDFISNFAIPYGSQDVSNHFFDYVKQKWKDLKMTSVSETLSVAELRDYLGFLPDDMFVIIEFENSELYSKSILPSDHESFESQKLPESSESGAVGGKSTQQANVSAETGQSEDSSKNSSELRTGNDLGKMSLGSEEASQESNEAMPKRKKSKKSKKKTQ